MSTAPEVEPRRTGIAAPTLATAQGATALVFWQRWWPHLTVLGLTALAIVVRWWALGAYDNEMWGDEATLMIEARRFLTGGHSTPFINDALGNPALFDFLLAQVFRVTGVSVTAARAYAGLWGALGVPLLYGLARELGLRRSTALAAAALLVTASWHVHLSRMVVINITGATTVEAVLYCTVATIRRRSWRWAALSGVSIALAMNSYIGARVIVPILGVWLLCLLLFNSPFTRVVLPLDRGAAATSSFPARRFEMTSPLFQIPLRCLLMCGGVALAVAIVLSLPLIQYYRLHPDDFSSHTIAVFAFSAGAMQRLFGLHPELPHKVWGVVQFQFEKTIGMFTAQGSTDVWFNMPGRPMLDGISSVFLIIGLLACLWSWRRPLSTLLLSWVFMVYIFGAFLAIDPPSAHKPIPIAPALCLVIALGIETALWVLKQLLSWPGDLRSGHRRRRLGLAAQRSLTALETGALRDPEGLQTRTWQSTRTVDLVTGGLLFTTVAVIGLVNIQRAIAYETSPGYQSFMSNPGIAWGRYLGRLGTPEATVVSPLGYAGEFPLLFAPRVTICSGEWAGRWQRCPPTRVVIFDLGADADAARYSAIVHRPAHPGPAPFGQRQFWSVTSPGITALPDPAVALGHIPRSS